MLVEDIIDGHENAKEAKIRLKKYKQSIGMFNFHIKCQIAKISIIIPITAGYIIFGA